MFCLVEVKVSRVLMVFGPTLDSINNTDANFYHIHTFLLTGTITYRRSARGGKTFSRVIIVLICVNSFLYVCKPTAYVLNGTLNNLQVLITVLLPTSESNLGHQQVSSLPTTAWSLYFYMKESGGGKEFCLVRLKHEFNQCQGRIGSSRVLDSWQDLIIWHDHKITWSQYNVCQILTFFTFDICTVQSWRVKLFLLIWTWTDTLSQP